MKEIVKKLTCFVTLVGVLGFYCTPLLVSAQGGPPTPISSQEDIIRILTNVRNIIWAVLGFVVVIMFIWAGITFVTAEGDIGKVEKARNRIMYGVIGIIVGLLAGGILALILSVMQR